MEAKNINVIHHTWRDGSTAYYMPFLNYENNVGWLKLQSQQAQQLIKAGAKLIESSYELIAPAF